MDKSLSSLTEVITINRNALNGKELLNWIHIPQDINSRVSVVDRRLPICESIRVDLSIEPQSTLMGGFPAIGLIFNAIITSDE